MKIGSLFSGGGLGDFGFLAAGFEIAWQVEIDPYCQKILALRYPESKKYHDIKTLKGQDLKPVDIITGGFPCQPFSNAGRRMGKQDDRHLWPEMLRIIQEARPAWVVGENVPGIVNLGLDTVLADLEASDYSAITLVFPAHALGAWHRRERIWIVAHSGHNGPSGKGNVADATDTGIEGMCERPEQSNKNMADSIKLYAQGRIKHDSQDRRKQGERQAGLCGWRKWWEVEPNVGRVAHGVPHRVHRLKMLGNGQVPACTYVIGKMIMDIEGVL